MTEAEALQTARAGVLDAMREGKIAAIYLGKSVINFKNSKLHEKDQANCDPHTITDWNNRTFPAERFFNPDLLRV